MFAWPTNYAGFDYTGFTLQSTTNLSSTGWIGVPATPVVIGGLESVTVKGARREMVWLSDRTPRA